jgi:hypothetical protein
MKRTLLIAAALMLAACGSGGESAAPSPTPSPTSLVVAGALEVPIGSASAARYAEEKAQPGAPGCGVDDGYDDIRAGAQVTVTDEAGKVIALGVLNGGTLSAEDGTIYALAKCSFPFSVEVPAGATFYGIEVANRGVVRYEPEALERYLTLTIG